MPVKKMPKTRPCNLAAGTGTPDVPAQYSTGHHLPWQRFSMVFLSPSRLVPI